MTRQLPKSPFFQNPSFYRTTTFSVKLLTLIKCSLIITIIKLNGINNVVNDAIMFRNWCNHRNCLQQSQNLNRSVVRQMFYSVICYFILTTKKNQMDSNKVKWYKTQILTFDIFVTNIVNYRQ